MKELKTLLCLVGVLFCVCSARAEEEASDAGETSVINRKSAAQRSGSKKKSKGGKHTREKEADGTEAPDRFEADTVIKSPYKLNGQPLEVDPD